MWLSKSPFVKILNLWQKWFGFSHFLGKWVWHKSLTHDSMKFVLEVGTMLSFLILKHRQLNNLLISRSNIVIRHVRFLVNEHRYEGSQCNIWFLKCYTWNPSRISIISQQYGTVWRQTVLHFTDTCSPEPYITEKSQETFELGWNFHKWISHWEFGFSQKCYNVMLVCSIKWVIWQILKQNWLNWCIWW